MTVFELHLQVNQRYQEVASHKRDKFRPEEIDLALNKAMYRLLETGVTSSFQDTHINLSHVAALIQKNKFSDVYIPSSSDPLYEGVILNNYSILPPDFYWLVNGRAEVVTSTVDCDTAPTIGTTIVREHVAVLPFIMPSLSVNPNGPYFSKVDIDINTPPINIYTSPYDPNNGIQTSFTSKRSKYIIINNILEYFYKNATYKFYWERYRNTYYKDSFIIVSSTNPVSVAMSIYIANRTGLDSSVTKTFSLNEYTVYNRGVLSSLQNIKVDVQPISITKATETYQLLKQNPFYKTRPNNIIAELDHDYLRVYKDESFIVTRVYYDYIRKPRTISLALNQSCELADTTHNKIVDLAVEILRLDTKDPVYPQTVQDTQIRTN